MKAKNFFSLGPPWVSNALSGVFALLLLISQLGEQIAELFGILNCETCISYLQKGLAIVAVILSILKVFMKAKPKIIYNRGELDNQSGRASTNKKNS